MLTLVYTCKISHRLPTLNATSRDDISQVILSGVTVVVVVLTQAKSWVFFPSYDLLTKKHFSLYLEER